MKKLLAILFVSLMIAGCSSSKLTNTWYKQDVQPKQYKKIMVLGLIRNEDKLLREKMEEHLVGDLKDLGYNAVCTCKEFGPHSFENVKEEDILRQFDSTKVDAVLTIVLLNKTKERYYVPARIEYSPYAFQRNNLWDYYITMNNRIYVPGYYEEDTEYFWESNFYDLTTRELLYTAQSRSSDPASIRELGHHHGLMIVNDMVKKNVLASQSKEPATE